ncbi:uncharacterized protein LOC115215789 [Argonauta hians]
MPSLELFHHLPIIIKKGFLRLVPLMVKYLKIDLNERDEEGKTALILCCYIIPEKYGLTLAQILIEKGCSVERSDKYGMNVLHHACIYERLLLTKTIIRAIDFPPNKKDNFGFTALHYSARAGNAEITRILTEYLLRYGYSLNPVDNENRTPFDYAQDLGYIECAEILMNAQEQSSNKIPLCHQLHVFDISPKMQIKADEIDSNISKTSQELSIRISDHNPSIPEEYILTTEHKCNSNKIGISEISNKRRENAKYVKRATSGSEIRPRLKSTLKERESVVRMLTPRSIYVLNLRRKPNEWNVTKLIMEKLTDYRNNPSYFMMNMQYLRRSTPEITTGITHDRHPITETYNNYMRKNRETCIKTRKDWRSDLKKIYYHYEFHCSLSYRSTAYRREIPIIANIAESGKDTDNATDKVSRRQRRSSNFPRPSAIADTSTHRKAKGRRSSIMSQNSPSINASMARTGTQREYSRTISSDSTKSASSFHKP